MEESQQQTVRMTEKFVESKMAGRDASHDAAHAFRVRDLALSLAREEGLDGHALEIVELAALLHDIGDYKYSKDFVEDTTVVDNFLVEENVEESKRHKILDIIKGMGFKNEVLNMSRDSSPEFGVVQDADRLDAIGAIGSHFSWPLDSITMMHDFLSIASLMSQISSLAAARSIPDLLLGIAKTTAKHCGWMSSFVARLGQRSRHTLGIARCFTYGGSTNKILYDPEIPPRQNLSKEKYMNKDEKQTTINHFYEKLFKLKDLMKTEAGRNRAERRHKFMESFIEEFHKEWDGRA